MNEYLPANTPHPSLITTNTLLHTVFPANDIPKSNSLA